MSEQPLEPPLNRPVLPGAARTDDERYLNMEELLALQKGPDELVHGDLGGVLRRSSLCIHRVEYQELWDVRHELSAKSQAES